MSYLILSTYPETGSKNSGDDLLGKSLLNLVKNVKGADLTADFISAVDNTPADISDITKYKAILAPALRPTIKGSNVAPQNRHLFLNEAHKYSIPVFAIGAGWKTYPGSIKQSRNLKLDENDKQQLIQHFGESDGQSNSLGAISCRDITTEFLLKNNGVKTFGTTGDCGLFDPKLLDTPYLLPKKIEKISVSMPHNKHHKEMAYSLALKLKKEFSCEVYITFHGYKGTFEEEINPNWDKNQLNFIDLSGGAENLSFYENIDAHVGFRLHAHIWFLRTRKPSLLIGEDGRGMGHLYTVNGLGYSAASNISLKFSDLYTDNSNIILKTLSRLDPNFDAIKMFREEVDKGYPVTQSTLSIVDELWKTKMKPFLENLPK